MRADRLISLLMLLQTNGRMTAQELSDRLEVSPRTIYRDLDALSASGVPVYAERGPQGGCMLMESYRTSLTGLKEPEVRALFMMTVPGLLTDLGAAKDSEAALLKLKAALPAPFQQDAQRVQERLHLDPAPWFQQRDETPYLQLLQQAVWQQQRIRMTYRRRDGRWVKRLMEPYALVAKANIWYVIGTLNSERPTVYRVSRIIEATLGETYFERQDAFELVAFWREWCAEIEAWQEKVAVQLQVLPGGVDALMAQFGDAVAALVIETSPNDDGTTTIELTFGSVADACRQLLGLATAVHILSPPELITEMQQVATAVLQQYTP